METRPGGPGGPFGRWSLLLQASQGLVRGPKVPSSRDIPGVSESVGFYQLNDKRSLNPSAPIPRARPQTLLFFEGVWVCGSALGQRALWLWCRGAGGPRAAYQRWPSLVGDLRGSTWFQASGLGQAGFWLPSLFFSGLGRSAGEGLQAGTCRTSRWVTVKLVVST